MRYSAPLAIVLLLVGLVACDPTHSPVGFRLPENGDVERGQTAFVELRCHTCHTVVGVEGLPPPDKEGAVVVLGGSVSEVRTDGYLVTSIIHPSHQVLLYPQGGMRAGSEPDMPDLTREMTVRQLVDLVAFLQAHYEMTPARFRQP